MKSFKIRKKSGGNHVPIFVRKKLKSPQSIPLAFFKHCKPHKMKQDFVMQLPAVNGFNVASNL